MRDYINAYVHVCATFLFPGPTCKLNLVDGTRCLRFELAVVFPHANKQIEALLPTGDFV